MTTQTQHINGVYPRACGGTGRTPAIVGEVSGLSPRLRGNPPSPPGTAAATRSIPAPAGEPPPSGSTPQLEPVYPRACGGTEYFTRAAKLLIGLSPRLRGNQPRPAIRVVCPRSIPAPAGEPGHPGRGMIWTGVYPRACGGTGDVDYSSILEGGLSPRLRGNLRKVVTHLRGRGLSPRLRGNLSDVLPKILHLGSIPAPAGEPTPLPS